MVMVVVAEAEREIGDVSVVIFEVVVDVDEDAIVPAFVRIVAELIILLIIVGNSMGVLRVLLPLLQLLLLLRDNLPPWQLSSLLLESHSLFLEQLMMP